MKKFFLILSVLVAFSMPLMAEGFIGAYGAGVASGQVYGGVTPVVSRCLPIGVKWEQDIGWFAIGTELSYNGLLLKTVPDGSVPDGSILLGAAIPISYHYAISDVLNLNVGLLAKSEFTLKGTAFSAIDIGAGIESSLRFDIADAVGIMLGMELSVSVYSMQFSGGTMSILDNRKFNVAPKIAIGYIY